MSIPPSQCADSYDGDAPRDVKSNDAHLYNGRPQLTPFRISFEPKASPQILFQRWKCHFPGVCLIHLSHSTVQTHTTI